LSLQTLLHPAGLNPAAEMLLRPLLRRAAAASAVAGSGGVLPTARPDPPASLASLLLASRSYAKAKGGGKPAGSTSNRGKVRAKDPRGVASADDAAGEFASGVEDDGIDDEFELPTDPLPPTYNPVLDVGPGGRPLFAFTDTFGTFHHRNSNVYVDFSYVAFLISRSLSPISVGYECA
jgi:small subunit ribosomal protein S29